MSKKMNTQEKLDYIFSELEKDVDRKVISDALGYKTFNGMDNFVRRKDYIWDGRRNMYYLPDDRNNGRYAGPVSAPRGKVREIISLFSKENSCARDIGEQLGFDGHRDLAKYMTAKGYTWDDKVGNYVLEGGKDNIIEIGSSCEDDSVVTEDEENGSIIDDAIAISGNYKDLLDYLLDNEGVLRQLLSGKDKIESEGNIPRYAVPGIFVTKSVHMTNHLNQLVRDFSKEKNISQRELFEVALVEFFRKYGYETEIDILIEQK